MPAPSQRFGNNALQQEGLEIHKPLAVEGLPNFLSIRHAQAGKQVQRPLALVAGRGQERLARLRRAAGLLSPAGLDRGLLIHADRPDPLPKQFLGLLVDFQHWPSALQESLGVENMLPGVVAPGLEFLGGKPAPNRAGRNPDHQPQRYQLSGDLAQAPAAQFSPLFFGQATCQGGGLRSDLRGEIVQTLCLDPTAPPEADRSVGTANLVRDRLVGPFGMIVCKEKNLGTHDLPLGRFPCVHQLAQFSDLVVKELDRILGFRSGHGLSSCPKYTERSSNSELTYAILYLAIVT